jgi:hypothetical protein
MIDETKLIAKLNDDISEMQKEIDKRLVFFQKTLDGFKISDTAKKVALEDKAKTDLAIMKLADKMESYKRTIELINLEAAK